jgi:DNA-binding NarL/FixJ family response regulator
VVRGESYLSSAISGHVVAEFNRLAEANQSAPNPLTPRQRQVLRLIASGQTTKAIARDLQISVKTAETHRLQIMEKLRIHDVAGLVKYAIRTGIAEIGT